MMHRAEQILAVLDGCCDAYTFPMLDNGYVYLAATRLSLFRSPDDWAIVIEVFGYSPRSALPNTFISTFASRLRNRKTAEQFVKPAAYDAYLAHHPHDQDHIVFPIEPGPWIDDGDGQFVSEAAKDLVLRGQRVPMPEAQDYRDADVELEHPPRAQVFELCRALAHRWRDQTLATADERCFNIPHDLVPLLTLDDWVHPDVVDAAVRPSRSASFQQLARVLASGDVGKYGPTEPGNTHWRNWPDGGTL
jgi:hypothetical protein